MNWVPLPQIPSYLKTKYQISDLLVRAFGFFKEDLDIDFNKNSGPHLITQILQSCIRNNKDEKIDESFFWDLTIGKRIEYLLRIATLENSSKLLVQFRCSKSKCHQQMEVEIYIEELAELQRQADETDKNSIWLDENKLHIRKPNGKDQLNWLGSSMPDEDTAARRMISSLVVNSDGIALDEGYVLTKEQIQTINKDMEELDPLVDFSLQTNCPSCATDDFYELNLEELAILELHRAQINLLQMVNQFATHYHWDEQQIFAIPPWRRLLYQSLIKKEQI